LFETFRCVWIAPTLHLTFYYTLCIIRPKQLIKTALVQVIKTKN